jgi:hypothetical protein
MKVKRATIHSYWLMFIATVITVGIVTSSQLITDRIGLLLDRQASELLAADMVIVSSNEFADEYREQARKQDLQISQSASLRTAIFIDDNPRLVELKAVDESYPLRGKLERAGEITGERTATTEIPSRGEVWVDTKLTQLVGTNLSLGEQSFEARWLLTYEPDRGGAIFNLAPRVLMNIADLPDTGLVVPGSRVRYRMMFPCDRVNARYRDGCHRNHRALHGEPGGPQGGDAEGFWNFAVQPAQVLPAPAGCALDCGNHHRCTGWLVYTISIAVGTGWVVWPDLATGLRFQALPDCVPGGIAGPGGLFVALPD